MDAKKKIKNEVESALLALHKKIDTLKEKVDQLCESTGKCNNEPERSSSSTSENK